MSVPPLPSTAAVGIADGSSGSDGAVAVLSADAAPARPLHPQQRVRLAWIEVQGSRFEQPTLEQMESRRMHVKQVRKQRKSMQQQEAGMTADEEDEDEDDDAPLSREEDEFVHEPVGFRLPAQQLRIKPHILERQMAPLLRATTAAELHDAQREVEQVSSVVTLASSQSDALKLDSEGGTHMRGNVVRPVTREDSLHPTWLERVVGRAAGTVRAVTKGAAKMVRLSSDEDDDEEDDDFSGGAGVTPLGGAFLSAAQRDMLPIPLKLTLLLPPEKAFGARMDLSTTSETSSGRAEMALSGAMTGYLGHAERLSFSVRQGLNSTSLLDLGENSLQLGLSVPELFTTHSASALNVALERHHLPDSSLESLTRGASVSWTPRGGKHALTAGVAHRVLRACSAKMADDSSSPNSGGGAPRWREPSPSVLAMVAGGAGVSRSLKTSLKYSFTTSSSDLDSPAQPTRGWTGSASAELAGLMGGDARWARLDLDAKKYWQLPLLPRALGASVGVGAMAQYVHNLSPVHSRVFVADRLFLGHSLNLRGYAPNAAGPHDGQDALGGEVALAAAAHLGFNLPSFASHGLRAGFFWNAGNLLGLQNGVQQAQTQGAAAALPAVSDTLPRGSSLSALSSAFLATTRQSVGFGVRSSALGARFEFNIAHPLGTHGSQANKWPIEFGIGMQWI